MFTNKLLPIIVSIIILILGNNIVVKESDVPKTNLAKYEMVNPCPIENKINHSILEEFFSKPYWSSARQETNTNQLDSSQINLLQSPEFNSTCEAFNNKYQEALSKNWSDGGETYKKFNVTYYKVDDYFFIVISLRQHEGYISTGVSYLDIYDENKNLIKGYAF